MAPGIPFFKGLVVFPLAQHAQKGGPSQTHTSIPASLEIACRQHIAIAQLLHPANHDTLVGLPSLPNDEFQASTLRSVAGQPGQLAHPTSWRRRTSI
jgi:hypothetical protein